MMLRMKSAPTQVKSCNKKEDAWEYVSLMLHPVVLFSHPFLSRPLRPARQMLDWTFCPVSGTGCPFKLGLWTVKCSQSWRALSFEWIFVHVNSFSMLIAWYLGMISFWRLGWAVPSKRLSENYKNQWQFLIKSFIIHTELISGWWCQGIQPFTVLRGFNK